MRRRELAELLERAQALLEQEQPGQAVALLEPLVEEHPRSPDAHYLLGFALADTGDPWSAITEIERALALGGDRSYVVPLVGLYADAGFQVHLVRAFRRARRWIRDLPSFHVFQDMVSESEEQLAGWADELDISIRRMEEGLYHMEEGQRALQQNDWEASIAASRRAIRYLGDWPPPHNNLSLALFYDGQPEEAIAEVRHVLSTMPDNIHALSNGIRFLAWAGREEEARELWLQLRTIEPQEVGLRIKTAEAAAVLGLDVDVYRLLAPLDREDWEYEVSEGLSRSAQRQLAIAEANLGRRGARRKLEALQGTHPLVDEVLDALKAGKPGPGWAERYPYYHSSEMLSHDQLNELVELLGQKEKLGEEHTRRELARFAQRYPQAVRMAEKWIWEEGLVEGGLIVLKLLDTPEARAALRRFGFSQAGEDAPRMGALQALVEAGEIGQDEELQVWVDGEWREIVMRRLLVSDETIQELSPAALDLIVEATEAGMEGDDARAEALYHQVLELEPRSKVAYANLGAIHIERGEVERGREMLRAALEIDPLYVHARCNLALLLLNEEEVEAAEEMIAPLSQVTRFHPEGLAFYSYVQARIHVERREYDAARQALEMSLDVEPDFEMSQDLLEWIEVSRPLLEMGERFSSYLRQRQERSRQRSRGKRLRLQHELTTPAPGLEEALPLYTKNALTGMARIVMPWGGWSALNKPPLIERIAGTLRDADELARVVADLDDESRAALREVVAAGGSMPWAAFDARYDNDLDESPHWNWHVPETVMGQLRLHGLLVETTVDGELLVAIPAVLRPALREILG